MTADGKISDAYGSAARFASPVDKQHLEGQMAQMDGVLFGAATLRAYGSSLVIRQPALLAQRQNQGKLPQPIQMVCSATGRFDPHCRFFQQPFPRWLLTPRQATMAQWQTKPGAFERLLLTPCHKDGSSIDWPQTLALLKEQGIHHLGVLGGGQLIASLFAADLLDFLWLTLCPYWVGGRLAPTPLEGNGLPLNQARGLELLSATTVGQEVFLHYRFGPRTAVSERRIAM